MSKHALLMLTCCLIPLAPIVALPATGLSLDGIALFLLFLLCPLVHILVMRWMGHNHGARHQQSSGSESGAPSCHGKTAAPETVTAKPRFRRQPAVNCRQLAMTGVFTPIASGRPAL